MKTRDSLFLAAASVAILLAGACSTMNTVEPAQTTAQRQMIPVRYEVTDAVLSNRVSVLGVNSATGPGGFLRIQVQVRNNSPFAQPFTYRVEWFDENGMIINLPTDVAIPRTLEAGETAFITATAPTEKAKDFRIKFLRSYN